MNELLRILFELQGLEFADTILPETEKRITRLRKKIPKPILDHYDRLSDRGKQGVALLHNQTCTGCHLRVPLATFLDAKQGDEPQMCGNCGRFLYFREEPVEQDDSWSEKTTTKSPRKQVANAR